MCVITAAVQKRWATAGVTMLDLCAVAVQAAKESGISIDTFLPVGNVVRVTLAGAIDPLWIDKPKGVP